MWPLLITLATAAEPATPQPTAHLTWKGPGADLRLHAPAGEHVAPDAPVDLTVRIDDRTLTLAAMGEDIGEGLALGDVRGASLVAEARLSLCEDGGTRCRIVDLALEGQVPRARRGTLMLDVRGGPEDSVVEPEGASTGFAAQVDADAVWGRARERAAAEDKPILLDFGAVWCPPCHLLSAQVLHADPRPAVVDAFVIAELDVDDPSSWALKDRYAVRGYPTLVAVDAEGVELGRTVGYTSLDDTVAWLDAVATGTVLRPSDAPTVREAAELAWDAVRTQREDEARQWLALAADDPDRLEFRLARFRLDPTLEDARWLAARAPGHALQWTPFARDLGEEAAPVVASAIHADLPHASPLEAADLLYVQAELAPASARPALYGAAAALVRGELTGDPEQDKGHYGWLALLTEHAGDLDGAVALLDKAARAFPEEPTFHVSLARMYLRRDLFAEAHAEAERAFETSWGDNRLTAATLVVRALVGLGRSEDARTFALVVLEDSPVPEEDLQVRTRRYRQQLAEAASVE